MSDLKISANGRHFIELWEGWQAAATWFEAAKERAA
jgi:hypothetical protein